MENADNGIRGFVIHRQAPMFMLPRLRDHFLHRQIIGNRRHLRARFHHFLHRPAVQADDLQDDFLLRLRQRPLLKSHLQQLLVIRSRQRRLWPKVLRDDGFQNPAIEPLRHPAQWQAQAHYNGQWLRQL